MLKSLVMVAITSIASLSLVSCGSSNASTPTDKVVEPTVTESKPKPNTWEKDSVVNDMGEKNIFYTVEANDKVDFDFPYQGGSTGALLVRTKNGKKSAMFTIDKGQIDTDYDGTYIRVKFDDEAPVKWLMAESSTGSSDVLFFENENKFISKLKTSKKVVLEVPFFRNGNRQFTFNTEGLEM